MDIFGDALLDWQAGHHDRRLTIRRDDDHVDTHDPGLYFAAEPFPHEVDLLSRARGPVLDVGCGAGRSMLWFQKQGIAVTGMDSAPGAVAAAQNQGCRKVLHGDIMGCGFEALSTASFQTVVVFGNNIGIGGTIDGAAALLSRLASVAAPGGQLLVTGLDIAQTENPTHLAYHQRNVARGRPRGEIKMRFEYQDRISDWVPWFHPEPEELRRLAPDAGWDVVKIVPAGGAFFAATLRKPERL